MRKLSRLVLGAGLVVGLALASPASAQAASACTVAPQVLPADPTYPGLSVVRGLGGKGHLAVGQAGGAPAYWKDGVLHSVPLPEGYHLGQVNAVNRSGLMVGTISDWLWDDEHGVAFSAFRYRPGWDAVKLYPTGDAATDVNDDGDATVEGGSDTGWVYRPDGRLLRTLTVPGSVLLLLNGIDDAGQVVGSATLDAEQPARRGAALYWSRAGRLRELRPTAAEPTELQANGIDDHRRIVGSRSTYGIPAQLSPGLSWSSPTKAAKPVPGNLLPAAISPTTKTVVGTVPTGSTQQAAVWRGGDTVDVLRGIGAGSTGAALAIGDDGRVGGSAVDPAGNTRAVVWACGRHAR